MMSESDISPRSSEDNLLSGQQAESFKEIDKKDSARDYLKVNLGVISVAMRD